MYKVKIFNKIAQEGLDLLDNQFFQIHDNGNEEDVILLRSEKLHEMKFSPSLMAIGRAGAGVNNIPVDQCTKNNIVVFNTPGANANAVKELVLAGMLLGSRNIFKGMSYVNSLDPEINDISSSVEKNKSLFKGFEIKGKTLGVIGLGAIGVLISNDASSLGMNVIGYDPYISVKNAWGLNKNVQQANNIKRLLEESDFITVHMPLNESTKNFLNSESFKFIKNGAIILNFSRSEIVSTEAIIKALKEKKVAKFVTDFPSNKLANIENVVALPHLGASTKEAETNCSIMVSNQIKDFVLNGNITNSVNFPNSTLDRNEGVRVTLMHDNKPNMVGQITSIIAEDNQNIIEMVNKSRDEIAYTLLDITGNPSNNMIKSLESIEGVNRVRIL